MTEGWHDLIEAR